MDGSRWQADKGRVDVTQQPEAQPDIQRELVLQVGDLNIGIVQHREQAEQDISVRVKSLALMISDPSL